jgi:spermidine synthase
VLNLYVVLPLALFGPPTVMMGLAYPILQHAVQSDAADCGRKVGLLQAANISGCVAGSLAAGLVALDHLGTAGTLRALAAVATVFAILGAREVRDRRAFIAAGLALAALAVAFPSQQALWMRLHGTSDPATIVAEDATGVAALIPATGAPSRWQLWAGGRNHSLLPFGGIHTALGALPATLHQAPNDVAIIGLGSGDTAASAGCRRDIAQRITVFELFASERTLLATLAAQPDPPPRLGRFLGDPRFVLRIEDGRNALEREVARYDVIEADALWPTHPYAGNLYSLEFFRLCAARLKPGGIVCTWAPTERVRATFARALPYVLAFSGGSILVGSRSPLAVDLAACRARLFNATAVTYLGPDRVNVVWHALQDVRAVPMPTDERYVNHDLFPRDEFNTPD